jgi:hypothetical protein
MIITQVHEEIINFIAAANPAQVASFRPSEAANRRVEDLIAREKEAGLTEVEKTELEQYLVLEHLMRLAKARAYQMLNAA